MLVPPVQMEIGKVQCDRTTPNWCASALHTLPYTPCRCVGHLHNSLRWFDHIEPSLITSLQCVQVVEKHCQVNATIPRGHMPPTSKLGMLLLKKGALRGETETQSNEF